MADTSAAWVLTILVVLGGIIGALLLTVTDPVMQALFDSSLWSASTSTGQDALGWQRDAWTYWPAIILLGFMVTVWIRTRQPS